MKDLANDNALVYSIFTLQCDGKNNKDSINYLLHVLRTHVGMEQVNYTIDNKHDNVYITKGTADVYPCVVAHYDQVHPINPNFQLEVTNGNLYAYDSCTQRQLGVGGDDKCGIFVLFYLLSTVPAMKAVLFANEEVGCKGSRNLNPDFFKDVSFAGQVDRKGTGDFCYELAGIDCCSEEFEKVTRPLITRYNYTKRWGGTTDAKYIAKGAGVSSFNMSGGYYEPHTYKEFVNLDELYTATTLMETLFMEVPQRRYEHKPSAHYYNNKGYTHRQNRHDSADACEHCGMNLESWGDYAWCYSCNVGFNFEGGKWQRDSNTELHNEAELKAKGGNIKFWLPNEVDSIPVDFMALSRFERLAPLSDFVNAMGCLLGRESYNKLTLSKDTLINIMAGMDKEQQVNLIKYINKHWGVDA